MNFYKKPTKAGIYLINNGDVVTKENMEVVNVYNNESNKLEFIDSNEEKILVDDVKSSWKWFPASELFHQIDIGKIKMRKITPKP